MHIEKQSSHKEGTIDVEQLPTRYQWLLEHAHKLCWCNNCAKSNYNESFTHNKNHAHKIIVHYQQLAHAHTI